MYLSSRQNAGMSTKRSNQHFWICLHQKSIKPVLYNTFLKKKKAHFFSKLSSYIKSISIIQLKPTYRNITVKGSTFIIKY